VALGHRVPEGENNMSCKVHKPSDWDWVCENSHEDNEFEHGYSVLTNRCRECYKVIVIKFAHAALTDNMYDMPILGLPEDK
jgi:hypothetical protein